MMRSMGLIVETLGGPVLKIDHTDDLDMWPHDAKKEARHA